MPLPGGDKNNSIGSLPLLWHNLQEALSRRFSSGKSEKRDRCILLLVTSIIITILISPHQHQPSTMYKSGQIANSNVRASRDYLVEDRKLTLEKLAQEAAKVPNIYSYNEDIPADIVARLKKSLTLLATLKNFRGDSDREQMRRSFAESLGVDVTSQELNVLLRHKPDAQLYAEIENLLSGIYRKKVVEDQRLFLSSQLSGVSIATGNGDMLQAMTPGEDPLDIAQARKLLLQSRPLSSLTFGQQKAIKAVVARMLRPSLEFNSEKTEELREAARQSVKPVLIQVKRGEMIVRDGDRVSADEEMKLAGMALETTFLGRMSSAIGVLGIVLVLLYFPYRFALKNIRKFQPSYKDIVLLAMLTLGHFLLLKVLYAITPPLLVAFPSIDTADYFFLFPFAATAIIIRIFINSEVALVFSAICAPLAGLMYDSLPVVLYSLLGCIIGAHGVRQCDNRSIVFTAGLKVSVVNVAMAVSFQLVGQNLFSLQTIYILVFAFAGGIAAAVLASGAIPLLESLFHYTTDIKLLELTNLNSPILRELMVRAPGTYHHSVVVGNLVESAAEAINANPLLARVAAYYHDIGKISKAQYFIENQSGGENRHDKLSPSMSALILIAHVKEGSELAKQHRLGQSIAEIIRQSHGTALIKYFYQRAVEQALPGHVVDEHEFRYPGPKPQTREAGLVLLADAVEAASRTLADSSPARIQGMVQKIINNIFIDGQLDECELTLKNLHEIAWSFNQILAGIHHHRIDYPQPAYKEKSPGGKKSHENIDNEPPKTPKGCDEAGEGGSSEDLKRLGMYF